MRRTIPCRKCGGPACELELPVLDGVAAQLFRPMLRLAAARHGYTLTPEVENPLEGLQGEAIAELLQVICASCASVPAVKSA